MMDGSKSADIPAPEAGDNSPPSHVYLVDGSGFIFRAFHALPPMTRDDGTPVNAVYGFCNMLMKLIDSTDADRIAIIFDAARATFRNDIYEAYKANRDEPPEELRPQFEIVREATRAFGMPAIQLEGFEADDLIATFARQGVEAGAEVTIVSSDKDLMQLVTDKVSMMDPMKMIDIGPDQVMEKFGVPPNKVVDVQALAGDSVDNVPGVPGIGVKTAALLINEYGDLETLLARAEEIKQPKRRQNLIEFADQARISRRLVELDAAAPVTETIDDFRVKAPDPETLLGFLKGQTFRSILAKVEARLADDGRIETPAPAETPTAEKNYALVQSLDALEAWVREAVTQGYVAVDTETTSLDAQRAKLVGVSLATAPGRACYIPLAHRAPGPKGELDLGDTAKDAPKQIPM